MAGEMHYPLHLLLIQLAVVSAFQALRRAYQTKFPVGQPFPTPAECNGLLTLLSFAYIASIGTALVFGYKAMKFSSSLPAAMFILALDWQPIRLAHRIVYRQLNVNDAFRYLILACGIVVIFVWDFRLNSCGRDMSLAFFGLVGLAELILALIREPSLIPWNLRWMYRPVSITNWPLWTLVPIAVCAFQIEIWRPSTSIPFFPTVLVLMLNTIATTTAVFSGGFVFKPILLCGSVEQKVTTESRVDRMALMLALTGLVSVGNRSLVAQPAVLSLWQFAGFFLAFLSFTTSQDVEYIAKAMRLPSAKKKDRFGTLGLENGVNLSTELLSPDDESDTSLSSHGRRSRDASSNWSLLVLLAVIGISWLLFTYTTCTLKPLPINISTPDLDTKYRPTVGLDIVVARYSQSATTVAQYVDSILEVPSLKQLKTRVFIYDKNSNTTEFQGNITEEVVSQNKISVVSLENIGREGDTYLEHMVSRWDDLANHTLFMQDEPHDFSLVKRRIEDYFIAETGFLSLSYEGQVCRSCDSCHDQSWSPDPYFLWDLYTSAIAHQYCHDLVLTYRGQFIVSGARIRGNEKAMYESLLHDFRDSASRKHQFEDIEDPWKESEKDSLENPVFGFTLERMWGVLMQCSELRIGYWSPSLLSSYLRSAWLGGRFPLENVQCLDRPTEI